MSKSSQIQPIIYWSSYRDSNATSQVTASVNELWGKRIILITAKKFWTFLCWRERASTCACLETDSGWAHSLTLFNTLHPTSLLPSPFLCPQYIPSVRQWKNPDWLIIQWFSCAAKVGAGLIVSVIFSQTKWAAQDKPYAASGKIHISTQANVANPICLHFILSH